MSYHVTEYSMVAYKLAIFDFDSTLVTSSSGAKFPQGVADRVWLPRRLEKLRALRTLGTKLAIATNQGGAAFGYFKPHEFDVVVRRFAQEADIDAVAVCYEHPQGRVPELIAESGRRKPAPGMLLELMSTFGVSPELTLYVGDREEDREAARRARVAFEWASDFFGDGDEWLR